MRRKQDADHGRVWTSTERTAGKSGRSGASVSPLSRGGVDLAAGGAEIDAAAVQRVNGHGVAQHVDVAVLLRQAAGERFPLVAAGAAAVHAELALGGKCSESLLMGTT